MSASLGIYRLQQVDRQIDRANAQLDTIRITLENDTELRSALERVETTQTQNQRSSHEMKNAEADVNSQKIKIEQRDIFFDTFNIKPF